MEGFTVILRDIMVILATSALVVMSLFGALVLWQLYRLGRELHAEMQPILASAQETAETVRGTAQFVSHRMTSRVSAAVSLGYTAHSFYQLVQQFYHGLRDGGTDARPTAAVPTSPQPAAPVPGPAAPLPPAGRTGRSEG